MRVCHKCTMPENFPGITINSSLICNFCEAFDREKYEQDRLEKKKNLEELLSSQHNPQNSYDCIVALSGGKDSCYTLVKLREVYGLNCLAITVDNGFLSPTAIQNSQKICDQTGSDLIIFRPSFVDFKEIYRKTLDLDEGQIQNDASIITRASQTCNSCINIINKVMIYEAFRRGIDLVAGGYIAGQIPDRAYLLNVTREWILKTFSDKSNNPILNKLRLSEYQIKNSLVNSVRVITPMLTDVYSQDEIINSLKEIGWEMPKDTGSHSSNCKLNDIGILHHINKFKFHPYQMEISEQVRKGELPFSIALEKLNQAPDTAEVNLIMNRLI